MYRQDTGELVTDSEGFLRGSLFNNMNKSHEKRKNPNESQENTKKRDESHEPRNNNNHHHHHHHHHHNHLEKSLNRNEDYHKKSSKSNNKQQHESDSSIKEPTTKKSSKNDEYRRSRTRKSFSTENFKFLYLSCPIKILFLYARQCMCMYRYYIKGYFNIMTKKPLKKGPSE